MALKNAAGKKTKAVDEDYEDAVEVDEEETEVEEEEEVDAEEEVEEEEEEAPKKKAKGEDFRARAAKNLKKKGAKPAKVAEKEKKGVKKVAKTKGTKGLSRAEWPTPWRPSSVLAQAFEAAQKGVTVKELTVLAKKNDCEPKYVIGAMKREKTRNWEWTVKGDDTRIKILNAHAKGAAKAKKAA